MTTTTLPTIPGATYLGRNVTGCKVYRHELGFDFMLTACCEAAVTGTTREIACKGCYRPVVEDTIVVSLLGRRISTERGDGEITGWTSHGYAQVTLEDGAELRVQSGTPGWDRCTLL